jgi:hypothetical protein
VTTNDWIPLAYLLKKLEERTWYWSGGAQDAYGLKYLTINLDTRDNCCTVFNETGKCVANSPKQLDELFARLDKESKYLTFQQAKKLTGIE